MKTVVVSCLLLACFALTRAERIHNGFAIYGGQPIKITEVPFMAQYHMKNYVNCGAVIVHERFLLTAGHCVRGLMNHTQVHVTVGTDDIDDVRQQNYEIEHAYLHPKYSKTTGDYDLGILKLKKKLTFSDRVQPIKMADSSLVIKNGEKLDTMGFGLTEKDDVSKVLLKVDVPYVERSICKKTIEHLTDQMMCAGGEYNKDSCNGDSGGPLRYKDTLVGLVSFGLGCGRKGFPGVYADLASMRSYVDSVIKSNA